MKKAVFTLGLVIFTMTAMAQQHLAFPFQGGSAVLTKFFKDSLIVSPEIVKKKAVGTAIFKFTADDKGNISKIIVYYADDAVLVVPIINALRKTNRKWIIPDRQKLHDFILPFSIGFNAPAKATDVNQRDLYDYTLKRKPIVAYDQVPLDEATLLPAITVKYNIE
ncbi:hypothetical protein EOD41_07240 [Mucilaginibacter limnophilus]|uniref:TonB C-terminal domain-containing protein n=1 Tax=Mucilaginibacter limnophilus TaxID=1932778 RepID=A0A3S2Y4E2_9SPHI|nr:hypothetical protein [Mucilaginibacter limnophilus]RVU01746.1 hypothetical protein EOD41_07240 [Mucilaginibacter limnophilus]